jgi:DNA polymerase II small subunit/DNA polymerase delta subunit B
MEMNTKRELEDKRQSIDVIGNVKSIRKTKNGHVLLKVDTPSANWPMLITRENHELVESSQLLNIEDKIKVSGKLLMKGDLVIATDFSHRLQ